MSAGDVYRTFYGQISGTGADSPSSLGRNSQKKVTTKSTSFLGPKKVQVRVMIETTGGQIPIVAHRIITMDFTFVNLELSMPDRLVNPLGFQVTAYSIAEDTQ